MIFVLFLDLNYFLKVRLILKVGVSTLEDDWTLFEDDEMVREMEKVDWVCDKDASFIFQFTHDYVLEYAFFYVAIQCWDWIIKKDQVFVRINSSS